MNTTQLISRKKLCNKLRLTPEGCRRIFGSNERIPLSVRQVVAKLNGCRIALPRWDGDGLPSVESCSDVVARAPIEIDGKPITRKRLQAACRRIHNPIPHWRIGPQTFLFPTGAVEWWASLIGSGVGVRRRVFHYGDAPVDFDVERIAGTM